MLLLAGSGWVDDGVEVHLGRHGCYGRWTKPSDWGSATAAGARGSGTRWEAAGSFSPLIRARDGEDRAGRGRRRRSAGRIRRRGWIGLDRGKMRRAYGWFDAEIKESGGGVGMGWMGQGP